MRVRVTSLSLCVQAGVWAMLRVTPEARSFLGSGISYSYKLVVQRRLRPRRSQLPSFPSRSPCPRNYFVLNFAPNVATCCLPSLRWNHLGIFFSSASAIALTDLVTFLSPESSSSALVTSSALLLKRVAMALRDGPSTGTSLSIYRG